MANPATSILGPSKDRTLLFFITDEGRLAMNEYTTVTMEWSANECPLHAALPTPNHISAAYRNGMVVVYGMIEKEGTPAGKPPQYIISELSPTVRYFAEKEKDQTAMTTTINKLAVVGDQKKQIWFYYLKLKTDTGPLELRSYYVKEGNPSKQSTVSQVKAHGKSRLAALYLPETNLRIVIYQSENNGLNIATIHDNVVVTEISNTLGALEGTPLTVSYSGTDQNRHLYLYYLSNVLQLTKTVGTWNGNSWIWNTQPQIVGSRFVKNTSQLTVTQDGSNNNLFFIDDESETYGYIPDALT
ncbi:MAG: hypothetical protein Q9163_004364 [Psora crenata]